MKESVLRAIEDARAVASALEKTEQRAQAHAVERLAQELFQSDARERMWRKALALAVDELEGREADDR